MKTKGINILFYMTLFLFSCMIIIVFYLYNLIPHRRYTSEDFGITTIKSSIDKDQDGIDDYSDIVFAAKNELRKNPIYKSAYYQGGYPPKEEGVCTDLIWRALKEAGYDLKQMIDQDIAYNIEAYPHVNGIPDPNIDFRRVDNIYVFLKRHCLSLTLDLTQKEEWQPGDIVTFSNKHIAILSDERNAHGIPFLLHHGGLPVQDEDGLWREDFLKGISGHFRFFLQK